jgi:hypothetical protein
MLSLFFQEPFGYFKVSGYSLPSQEIAVRGFAPHRYFLVLYAYFFSGKEVATYVQLATRFI